MIASNIVHRLAVDNKVAHWEVLVDPYATVLVTKLLVNHTGVDLAFYDAAGTSWLKSFHQGDAVVLDVPVGNWILEASADGTTYTEVSRFISILTVQETRNNTGCCVFILLDGSSATERWVRYRRLPDIL